MITTDNNSIRFTSKTFHWWPFSFFDRHYPMFWRGFVEQDNITLTDDKITVSFSKDCKGEFSLPIKDLEYCINEKKIFSWRLPRFCMGNTRVSIGIGEEDRCWKGGNVSYDRFYIDFDEFSAFIDALEAKKPICFSEESEMIKTRARWYRIDKLLSGNRNTLWMNDKHIISSERISWGWCVRTKEIKYFFTRGVIHNNLYVGSEKNIRISNVTNEDVKIARKYIKLHGGNIADDTAENYHDSWTPKVIFSPSLWFTHSSIGFTDNGVVYHQKTFKTNDDIFLPYDKINMAIYESKWYWLFTNYFSIYGEQNIIPVKRFSKKTVDEIRNKLEAAGVKKIEGKAYAPSYHTSWFGILLSIVTLSLYHWLVVATKIFQKRNTLILGEDRIAWNGRIYGFTKFRDGYHREILKNLSTLVLEGKDIKDVVYIKKHWYNIWGHLFILAHPFNIRWWNDEAGDNQRSVDYDLEITKIWSWNVRKITSYIKEKGFTSADKEDHRYYKKWCKHYMKKKYK